MNGVEERLGTLSTQILDTERLDWLERSRADVEYQGSKGYSITGYYCDGIGEFAIDVQGLRAAIDAAMRPAGRVTPSDTKLLNWMEQNPGRWPMRMKFNGHSHFSVGGIDYHHLREAIDAEMQSADEPVLTQGVSDDDQEAQEFSEVGAPEIEGSPVVEAGKAQEAATPPVTPSDPRLSLCPFCGCEGWIVSSHPFGYMDHSRGWRVECQGLCHAMTCWWHSEAEAIEHWNRRPVTSSDEERLDIVFDDPPSHESGRFVEVEDMSGKSVRFGEWIHRPDGFWALRIPTVLQSAPADEPASDECENEIGTEYGVATCLHRGLTTDQMCDACKRKAEAEDASQTCADEAQENATAGSIGPMAHITVATKEWMEKRIAALKRKVEELKLELAGVKYAAREYLKSSNTYERERDKARDAQKAAEAEVEKWKDSAQKFADLCEESRKEATAQKAEIGRMESDRHVEVNGFQDLLEAKGKEIERLTGVVAGREAMLRDEDAGSETLRQMLDEAEQTIATLREAVGLATTAAPDVEMDANDPVGMMHRVVNEVGTLRGELSMMPCIGQKMWNAPLYSQDAKTGKVNWHVGDCYNWNGDCPSCRERARAAREE